jgi:hypothetical protein
MTSLSASLPIVLLYTPDRERLAVVAACIEHVCPASVLLVADPIEMMSLIAGASPLFELAVIDLDGLPPAGDVSPALVRRFFAAEWTLPTLLILPGPAERWHVIETGGTVGSLLLSPCSRLAVSAALSDLCRTYLPAPCAVHAVLATIVVHDRDGEDRHV